MEVDNQGEFGGLGIEISLQDGQLTVKQPIEGTPAWDAGLKSEDRIVRIENTSTINMDLDELCVFIAWEGWRTGDNYGQEDRLDRTKTLHNHSWTNQD